MDLDVKQIMDIIPHRYPFLFVDRVEGLEPGKKAVGYKSVSINEPFFQGHFPGEPVMPGVLQVEAIAQLGAIIMLSLPANKGKIAFFGGIKEVKFKKKVLPGDMLKMSCEIIDIRGPIGRGKGIIENRLGELVMQAELIFAIGT